MAAVRVPPSAWMTSQSTEIWRSPSLGRSTTARSARPIRRWISCVRPEGWPTVASRRVRSLVARGSMPYSAVTQPRPWPLSQGGRRSSRLAVQIDVGIAELDEAGALGVHGHRPVDGDAAKLVGLAFGRTHGWRGGLELSECATPYASSAQPSTAKGGGRHTKSLTRAIEPTGRPGDFPDTPVQSQGLPSGGLLDRRAVHQRHDQYDDKQNADEPDGP